MEDCKISVRKPEENRPLGRHKRRWLLEWILKKQINTIGGLLFHKRQRIS
jgi:hypothetical protein